MKNVNKCEHLFLEITVKDADMSGRELQGRWTTTRHGSLVLETIVTEHKTTVCPPSFKVKTKEMNAVTLVLTATCTFHLYPPPTSCSCFFF